MRSTIPCIVRVDRATTLCTLEAGCAHRAPGCCSRTARLGSDAHTSTCRARPPARGRVTRSQRNPQDPARRRSSCRRTAPSTPTSARIRAPTASRCSPAIPARSPASPIRRQGLRQAVPRHERIATRGGPHSHRGRDPRHRRRQDERLHQARARRGRLHVLPELGFANLRDAGSKPDVMGYHDRARSRTTGPTRSNFVLQDHMFEPNARGASPPHLFMVSGWSARCSKHGDPMSCKSALDRASPEPAGHGKPVRTTVDRPDLSPAPGPRQLALLRRQRHPARLRRRPDGLRAGAAERAGTPGIWNPLPYFDTVQHDDQLGNVRSARATSTAQRRNGNAAGGVVDHAVAER